MQNQLTLFAEASPAKTSAPPIAAAVRAWAESEAGFGSRCYELSETFAQHGLSARMSLACFPATDAVTSESSSTGWQNSGMVSPTGRLTLSSSESPSDAAESTLSGILETDVPQKYYLSQRACAGILSRATSRGRTIPPMLLDALRRVAWRTP